MSDTVDTLWRRVMLQAPEVPVFLARQWIQQAYVKVCSDRPWNWLRKEVLLTTLASRTLVAGVTAGSTVVTSAGLFVASDAGRQLRTTSIPVYTLSFVDANTLTLDQPYAGESDAAASVTILDAYLIAPADFAAWMTITDPSTQRPIPFWITEDQLHALDPQRSSTGDPARALVSRGIGQVAGNLGRILYEWWPYPTAARSYPALYRKDPGVLADTDTLQGVLANRGDLLVSGAMAEVARWPGTNDRRNPYFNLALANSYSQDFNEQKRRLALQDDNQFPQDLGTVPWWAGMPLSMDTHLLRSTDAGVGDYL